MIKFMSLKKVINLCISCILNPWLRNLNTDFTVKNYLFGSVNLTDNADLDKYKYSGYIMGFDSRSEVSFTDGCNVILFGISLSSSVHINNKNEDILILNEAETQEFDDTTLTIEANHPISYRQPRKRFVLNLHSHGSNSSLFVNTKTNIPSQSEKF